MYALSSFSSTIPLKYIMQLDPTHQHHFSLLPLLFMTNHSSQNPKTQLDADQKIKKRLIGCLAVVRLKELKCSQQNTETVAITATSDKPVKRAETLSMQVKVLYWLHLAVMYPSL